MGNVLPGLESIYNSLFEDDSRDETSEPGTDDLDKDHLVLHEDFEKTTYYFEDHMKFARNDLRLGDCHSPIGSLTHLLTVIPKGRGDLLCAAYALRAEVLLAGRHFEACVRDANRALHLKPDDDLLTKIMATLNLAESYEARIRPKVDPERPVPALVAANPMVPCASDAMALVEGRFVAAREIKPGEVLLVEEPLAWYSCVEHHCGHCFKQPVAPIPCPDCTPYVFCDERCQDAARELHSKVCRLLPQVMETSDPNDKESIQRVLWLLIAARASTLQASEQDAKQLGVTKPLESGDPSALLLLKTPALVVHTLSPALLQVALDADLEDDELDLLLAALKQLVPCVAKATFDVHQIYHDKESSEITHGAFGKAVYPILALVTPACSPNAFVVNYGHVSVLQATRMIPKGTLVTHHIQRDCWARGHDFLSVKRPLRWDFLQSLGFLNADEGCICEACVNEWPLLDQLESRADDPETQMLIFKRLDEQTLPSALAKAEQMEREGLQHTLEFHLLQKSIRLRLAEQGNVFRNEEDFYQTEACWAYKRRIPQSLM